MVGNPGASGYCYDGRPPYNLLRLNLVLGGEKNIVLFGPRVTDAGLPPSWRETTIYAKLFGGIISFILLGVYVYLVITAAGVVGCAPQPACLGAFTGRMATAMAVIGGLVSALVVAELAITEPGKAPLSRMFDASSPQLTVSLVKYLTLLYLLVWTAAGLYAFLVSLNHDELQPLVDLGESWLGLAVAASYAYFGIKPK